MNADRPISLIESDSSLTTRELADLLGCCKSTVANHLQQLGFKSKIGRWVPHRLTETHKQMRVDICTHLLLIKPQKTFLRKIVTGDEKWILYYNQRRKRHWVQYDADPPPEPKADLHPKKVMISVFWDDEGILYHEYLPKDETINKERYCNQLDKLRQAIQTLRPTKTEVHLLHDNARPHIAKLVKEKLETFGWNIIPHPPYSPDIAPNRFPSV